VKTIFKSAISIAQENVALNSAKYCSKLSICHGRPAPKRHGAKYLSV